VLLVGLELVVKPVGDWLSFTGIPGGWVCGSGINRFRSSPQRDGVALWVGDIPSCRSDDCEERELCPGRLDPW
jgi:hypothetical protein